MSSDWSRKPLAILARLGLGYFVLLATYLSVLIVGREEGGSTIEMLLSVDDKAVELVAWTIPKVESYRVFMEQNGYAEKIQFMEHVYLASWLAFLVVCALSLPFLPGSISSVRSWLVTASYASRDKVRFSGPGVMAGALLVLFGAGVGTGFGGSSRFDLDKIHLNEWYALWVPFGLTGAYIGLFSGLAIFFATRNKESGSKP